MANFQTVEQFLAAPFGKPEVKSNDYEAKYKALVNGKRIHLVATTQIDEDFLIHLTVGSDSSPKDSYDVVLLFFTDDEVEKKKRSFRNYYVKFFSNSPSFIYSYAALYKANGFLIDVMYDKLDQEYADKLPEKVNSDHKLSYDKSIYCACRFLQDTKFDSFNKFIHGIRKKNPDEFFRNIRDFSDIKMTSDIRSMNKKIDTELKKNKQEKKSEKKSPSKKSVTKVTPKRATNSTLSSNTKRATKTRPRKSTMSRKKS
jgi:hypothetical protein